MKIRLLQSYANASGRLLSAGQIIEVDALETKRLIAEKIAERLTAKTKTKTKKK